MFDVISYFQLLILFTTNLIILFYRKKLYLLINIEDKADGLLKIHKNQTYSIGGIIFFINILLFAILDFYFNKEFTFLNNENLAEALVLIFSLSIMFFIGIYDDKYFLSYRNKFLLLLIVILPCLIIDKNLVITNINFTFTEKSIYLDKLSIPVTVLCIMLFINALNLFDGIDLQAGSYILILSLYFIFILNLVFFVPVLIGCVFFLYLNFKKEIFLGDSGAILIGFLISYFCIKLSQLDIIRSDQIFIIMMLPGIDMFRLFLIRLFKKKNPFKGDRNHLHHIMIDKHGYLNSYIYIQLLILIPLLLMIFSKISSMIIIITTLIIYIYLVFIKK